MTAILQDGQRIEADRAVIAVPVGLLRAGLPALDPAPPERQRIAIGRLGYGAGILGKLYLRFPRRFWPDQPKWFGRLPDSPQQRGGFNTWVSHEQETGLPILLSFCNGHTAIRLDREASDAEVTAVAMRSLRAMFGDDIPEPEAMVFPRWLSDPWSRGGYSYPGVGSDPTTAPPTRDRSATVCSSRGRRPSRSSMGPCMRPFGRPSRPPRRSSVSPPEPMRRATRGRGLAPVLARAGTMRDKSP